MTRSNFATQSNPQQAGIGLQEWSILVTRAVWLVGVCGGDLPAPQWAPALSVLVHHMSSADLVLALTSVSALMALCSSLLEQQQARPACFALSPAPAFTSQC